jgi:uncharacterized membrane protein YdbT with pleckstrin-like domain
MAYADSLLTQGETILLRSRQHILALILDSRLAIVFWTVAVIAVIVRLWLNLRDTAGDLISLVVLVSLLGGIIIVAFRWWEWHNTEYVITNRRLLNVNGILNKRSADSSLEKINDAILNVNVVGRLLGYGDLKILTAADAAIDRYRMLNDATGFKKVMMSAKHALQTGDGRDGEDYMSSRPAATPAAASAPATPVEAEVDVSGGADPLKADTPEEVTAVLAQLTRLRDQGAISSGEFEMKKRELLDRL